MPTSRPTTLRMYSSRSAMHLGKESTVPLHAGTPGSKLLERRMFEASLGTRRREEERNWWETFFPKRDYIDMKSRNRLFLQPHVKCSAVCVILFLEPPLEVVCSLLEEYGCTTVRVELFDEHKLCSILNTWFCKDFSRERERERQT